MSLQPEFMLKFKEFDSDRQKVRTVDDWVALKRKWFDHSKWPVKGSEQLAEESKRKKGPFSLGARKWGYTTWIYDLTPEARYEYFLTLFTVGDAVRFPHLKDIPKVKGRGSEQECPYCEISTSELGPDWCLQCMRKLIYRQVSE